MKDSYDFSKGVRSPFVLKDKGYYTIRVHSGDSETKQSHVTKDKTAKGKQLIQVQ